ncbi:interferon-induced transmembrane protein 3-like isoform X2 [Tachysurus fulvidraco]|uniref:interferon-induced transmembrane protein 3-like isoform X2 n=1 Tax=Tachysurus fulvidraco TaxID=1234273 RepID=UPI001FF04122|nr:interferon-induced transmembrane protein 3-like isoform X2 [Tachysurus fulvidraco]
MQNSMVPLNPQPGSAGAGTVVVVMPQHPTDYVVWSIASIVYGNPCCLGLLAFYFSIKARDRKMVGDLAGATSYGSKACCVNGFALGLIIFISIVIIAVLVSKAVAVTNSINRYPY